jgi:hypothetical protein
MRITVAGNVGIGTTTIPSKLTVDTGWVTGAGQWASTAIAIYNPTNIGAYSQISFGYTPSTTNAAAYIGFISTNQSSNGFGDLVFGTRSVSTDTQPTERMRITSTGYILIPNAASAVAYLSFNYTPVDNRSRQWRIGTDQNQYGDIAIATATSQGGSTYSNRLIIDGSGTTIVGSLSKSSGSFRIDHPLKPNTHQLVHSFIEGPQADLIYRGKLTLVNGKAQANIDEVSTMTEGTFEALCREVQCFTTNENGWDLIKGKVIGNIIYIESQNPNSTDEISWMVIGERKDKHMMDTEWTDEQGKVIVEPLKAK